MKLSLDDVILRFARFLTASWGVAYEAAGTMKQVERAEFMSDWTQANWELLVETPFRELAGFGKSFLESYGEGADCNEKSSRVWLPEVKPTHRIACRPRKISYIHDMLSGNVIDVSSRTVVFNHFANKSVHGWYEQAPPFDHVLGYYNDQEVLLSIDQVSFMAEEIGEEIGGGVKLNDDARAPPP
ncbi:MAG: hypothetical protein CVV12_14025 [Gammaproteobacteria bacterium HGW-Gammaproteobacteria-2]|jgi:hypothetical protein|nr:MAG: hypothetical protein CVV12_14025 [Gammaproteobacteria bacterium HGW-Gammaproteobacteria-2]